MGLDEASDDNLQTHQSVDSGKTIIIFWFKGTFKQAVFFAANRCKFCRAKAVSSFKHVRNSCDIAATNRTENRTSGLHVRF